MRFLGFPKHKGLLAASLCNCALRALTKSSSSEVKQTYSCMRPCSLCLCLLSLLFYGWLQIQRRKQRAVTGKLQACEQGLPQCSLRPGADLPAPLQLLGRLVIEAGQLGKGKSCDFFFSLRLSVRTEKPKPTL